MTLNVKLAVILSISYVMIAFAFSFVGFVAQEPTVHFHEYSFPEAVLEIGGHFMFGALAALPFLSLEAVLLGGSFAVGVDADHILGALNLNVSSRPDHSVVFGLFAMVAVWGILKYSSPNRSALARLGLALLVPVSLLAHVAYDILAAYLLFQSSGFSFPISAPFGFSLIPFHFWDWVPFEAAALMISITYVVATLGRR